MGQQAGALLLGPSVKTDGVAGTGIKGFASGLGMRSHNRVAGLHGIGIHRLAFLGNAGGTRCRHLGLAGRADHAETGQRLLQPVRQPVPGKVLVGEQRVTANRRQLDRLQHGRHRRLVLIDRVGVPDTAKIDGFVLAFQHRGDFGEPVQPVQKRIDVWLADRARQRQLTLRRKILIPYYKKVMFQPDCPDIVDQPGFEIFFCKVQTRDLGAHGRCQWCHLHPSPLRQIRCHCLAGTPGLFMTLS